MSTTVEAAQKRNTPIEKSSRSKITVKQKRWLLAAHLVFTTAWLGAGFCSLALNITALSSSDPHLLNFIYSFAATLDTTISRGGAGGTLLTGISLALLTQWGLVRFYWIIAKEIGSILCVLTDLIVIRWNEQVITLTATQGLQAISNPLFLNNRTLLLVGIFLKIVLLATVIVIALFKPWGQKRRRGLPGGESAHRKVTPSSIVASISEAVPAD